MSVVARLVHPDRQVESLLRLFDGAKAPHPAAALSGWKRATGGALDKTNEALIALFNPGMVAELRALDGALVHAHLDRSTVPPRWAARIARDDGTLAALATALALTDGRPEEPLGPFQIDRLGPEGSPLLGCDGASVLLGTSREELRRAARGLPELDGPDDEPGVILRIEPRGPDHDGPLWRRRALAFLEGIHTRESRAFTGFDGSRWSARFETVLDEGLELDAALDDDCLDWVPGDRCVAAIALAFDPRSPAWKVLFEGLDRAVRVDPTQADTAPLRTRLATLALPAGIWLESQVWPRLRGASLAVLGHRGEVTGLIVVAQATDGPAAERLAASVVPRAARLLRGGGAVSVAPDARGVRPLGDVSGWPMEVARRGPRVLIGWGAGALDAALQLRVEDSVGALVRARFDVAGLHRAGVFWPGRWSLGADASDLATQALAACPLVFWRGWVDGDIVRDVFHAEELDVGVRRWFDGLPLDLPPETRP